LPANRIDTSSRKIVKATESKVDQHKASQATDSAVVPDDDAVLSLHAKEGESGDDSAAKSEHVVESMDGPSSPVLIETEIARSIHQATDSVPEPGSPKDTGTDAPRVVAPIVEGTKAEVVVEGVGSQQTPSTPTGRLSKFSGIFSGWGSPMKAKVAANEETPASKPEAPPAVIANTTAPSVMIEAEQPAISDKVADVVGHTATKATTQAAAPFVRRKVQRRMSAENVLFKRAEMENRAQTVKAHKRLEQYRVQCDKARHRRSADLERKADALSAKLIMVNRMQQSFADMAFDKEEIAAIIAENASKHGSAAEDHVNDDDDGNETLSLETELVQNMHNMIALEKQLSMMKKQQHELKKYLVCCQTWLQDCDTFHDDMYELQAQNYAMNAVYRNTLRQSEAMIYKYSDLL
jgi:hypothetical protein